MKIRAISAASLLYAAGLVGDWISSWTSNKIPGVLEANGFYRDEAYKWVFHKAFVGDMAQTAIILGLAGVLWKIGDSYKKGVGEGLACLPLVYYGFDRLLTADLPNFLFALHFYVSRS